MEEKTNKPSWGGEPKYTILWKNVLAEKLFDAQVAPATIVRIIETVETLMNHEFIQREQEIVEMIGHVDEEFLAQSDAEDYVGEWAINKDRKRILNLLKGSNNNTK